MTVPSTAQLAVVARAAARAGGDYLADAFRQRPLQADYHEDDVKAEVDREAERRVLDVVADAYPDYATHGEESGRRGDADHVWVVDPLDGTNNFASGLPSFATAVCVLRDGDPVVAAIHEPLPDTTYVARAGEGATVDGEPLHADSDVPLDRGTVSLVLGLSAVRDPERRTRGREIEHALENRSKRVLETWSPCVDWGLVAAGNVEGIVCYHPDVFEQYAGELLAAESGVVSESREGLYVGASDRATLDELVAALPDAVR